MLIARASGFKRAGLVLGALALLGARAGAAPDAAAIIKRAEAAVAGAKTYQATIVQTINSSGAGSVTISTDVKAIPSAGKTAVHQQSVGKATGMAAMQAAMANMTAVDDGKTAYVYMAAMKGYRKGPHRPGKTGPHYGLQGLSRIKGLTYRLLSNENIDGRSCYAVQLVPPKQRPGITQKVIVYVDQATGRMKQLRQEASGKAAGGKGQAIQQSMTVTIRNEILNAPIADSVFRFVPPPGAKELPATPPAGMMPHGSMGAPSSPHR